mgnify:FL=1
MKNKIEFETLHSNKHRIYLLCGIVCIVVLMVTLIITTSKAKYKTTQSLPLINGTINYDLSDLNLIGAYIQEGEEYIQTNEIPLSGYEFNSEKSYCTVNGENINATINFDIETQTLSIVPLTKKGTKCYLYFDEKSSGSEYILASPNAPTNHTTDWTGKESYYYTGNPDNWVSFAGFYWRIIRINGDGSIRMIYQGVNDSPTPDAGNMTGEGTQIGTSAFNTSANHKTYVGLVYNETSQHGYGTNSTVMNRLNDWYNSNLTNYEEKYIDTETGFCSDRNMANGSIFNDNGILYYAPSERSYANASLNCNELDILSQDNKKLPNSIGLLTSDEYLLASNTDDTNYLMVEIDYWTMSPHDFSASGSAGIFTVWSMAKIMGVNDTDDHLGVRPVINVKADVQITGTGSQTDPFKVATS